MEDSNIITTDIVFYQFNWFFAFSLISSWFKQIFSGIKSDKISDIKQNGSHFIMNFMSIINLKNKQTNKQTHTN